MTTRIIDLNKVRAERRTLDGSESLEMVVERNRRNKERVRKEREQANEKVLDEYKIRRPNDGGDGNPPQTSQPAL